MISRTVWPVAAALVLAFPNPAFAQKQGSPADETAIRANLASYLEAYRTKDAAALAALWSESGEFVHPVNGAAVRGREGIEKAYREMFDGAGEVALEAEIGSLRFITGEVAVEEGIATVVRAGEAPEPASYRVVHVKRDGKWLIDSVRETVLPEPPAEAISDGLDPLAWLVGEWLDAGEGSAVELRCEWAMGGRFLKREFAVSLGDEVTMDGVEVIGWDAAEKKVRSWVFDSGGGFGSAEWSSEGDTWTKKVSGITAEGRKLYAVHVMTKTGDDRYEWRAHSRVVDGELLPNIDTVIVTRRGAE